MIQWGQATSFVGPILITWIMSNQKLNFKQKQRIVLEELK